MSLTITARAAARITPRMAFYQAKRHVRNRLVPKFAVAYERLLQVRMRRIPSISQAPTVPAKLCRFVGSFYECDSKQTLDAAAAATFSFYSRDVAFKNYSGIDWQYKLPEEKDHNLWRMKLCQLEIIHTMLVRHQGKYHDAAAELIAAFESARTFRSHSAFTTTWSPYGTSHRILGLVSGLILAEQSAIVGQDLSSLVRQFLRQDAAFLWSNVEHDLKNNHTERNLAALCFYHLAAGEISSRRGRRLDREVRRIIDATVLSDGTQVERSAMYQGLTVMSLRIFESCYFLSPGTRNLASTRARSAEDAWSFLTHDDGDIALFNDSWVGEIPQADRLVGGGDVGFKALQGGGYFRASSGDVRVLMDAGPIGPRWNPGHGHADFLAVEVDVAGQRLIVDPGTSQYFTGSARTAERSAANHNGPYFQGVEPIQYAGCFKVGKSKEPVILPREYTARITGCAAAGVLITVAGSVMRMVSESATGGVTFTDVWSTNKHPGQVRLLLASPWSCEVDRNNIYCSTDVDEVTVAVRSGRVQSSAIATWSRRYMHQERATEVLLAPEMAEGLSVLTWTVGSVSVNEANRLTKSTLEVFSSLPSGSRTRAALVSTKFPLHSIAGASLGLRETFYRPAKRLGWAINPTSANK